MITLFVLVVAIVLIWVMVTNPGPTLAVVVGIPLGLVCTIGGFWLLKEYPVLQYAVVLFIIAMLIYDPKRKKDSSLRSDKEIS